MSTFNLNKHRKLRMRCKLSACTKEWDREIVCGRNRYNCHLAIFNQMLDGIIFYPYREFIAVAIETHCNLHEFYNKAAVSSGPRNQLSICGSSFYHHNSIVHPKSYHNFNADGR